MSINFDDLQDIQGNIFGPFNKDHEKFLMIKFADKKSGREFIGSIVNDVEESNSAEIIKFNNQFKTLKKRHGEQVPPLVKATWTCVAFTFNGLKLLSDFKLDTLKGAFVAGMAARATDNGDVDKGSLLSDPSHWIFGGTTGELAELHAMVCIASDDRGDLNGRLGVYLSTLKALRATVHVEDARAREDEPGHEHFGFKDGVSQPGIKGINPQDDPLGNPEQRAPGSRFARTRRIRGGAARAT